MTSVWEKTKYKKFKSKAQRKAEEAQRKDELEFAIQVLSQTKEAVEDFVADACYAAALDLVDAIEPWPNSSRLTVHWRNTAGELLTTLDEVIRADLAGELVCNGRQ